MTGAPIQKCGGPSLDVFPLDGSQTRCADTPQIVGVSGAERTLSPKTVSVPVSVRFAVGCVFLATSLSEHLPNSNKNMLLRVAALWCGNA